MSYGYVFFEFHQLCQYNSWSYTIRYEEAPNEFEIHVFGAGQGEDWLIRKACGPLEVALCYIVDKISLDAGKKGLNIYPAGRGEG